MSFFRNNKILIAILIVAALLRLWKLADNPPHLTSDEAALGYNAYSILKTAHDEHGKFLPIIFQSFGDWKPGLYIYLDVPFVAVLGLNEWSARLPGALSGIVAVYGIYLIVGELFAENKFRKSVQLASAFFLATSPWHLQFSRGAWEAGLSLTLTIFGIYFFLKAIKQNSKLLLLSASLFGLTFWTYQGAKLSSLIVLLGLLIFFGRWLLAMKKNLIISAFVIGLIVSLPIFFSVLGGRTGRLEVFSVFSYPRPEEVVNKILAQGNIGKNSVVYYVYHSEGLNFLRGISGRWFNYFSGRFLLFSGDWEHPRHGVPDVGEILLIDIIFLILGLVAIAKSIKRKESLFVLFWFLASPIPAALSRDSIHAVRSLNMVVPLTIVIALGATSLWEKTKNFKHHYLYAFLFLCLYVFNFLYYLDAYWIHAPKENSVYWQYGYKTIVNTITPIQKKYKKIVVQQSYSQPYIFFLFYQKYDPIKYQKISAEVYKPNKYGDVGLVSDLDNIEFRDINWQDDSKMSGNVFAIDTIKVPLEQQQDLKQFKLIKEIKYLNNEIAFRILEIR